jgi:pimeloyl-ACP methyl ester carboxylesterase
MKRGIMFTHLKNPLRATVFAMSLLLSGCGSISSQETGSGGAAVHVDPRLLLAGISSGIQQPAARALAGWQWGSFLSDFGSLLTGMTYTLNMQKISYQSMGADGRVRNLTGLLILPKSTSGARPSVPILLYQHGTEPFRDYSPSQFLSHMNSPTDYPEVMVAAAIASTGYAVAMADYEGLGDDRGTQPYVHGASLARQVVDMLKASRDTIEGTAGTGDSPCSWNRQLFLMGYSEGGYVTMVTTRELQLNYAADFTVTASAPLSGPYDLSGVMRTVMLSDATSKAPYFLPFLLTGYNYATAGRLFSPSSAMSSPYNATIAPLFDGTTTADKISEAMGMSFNPVQLIVPKTVLTQQFVAELSEESGPATAFLKENDSYRKPGDVTTAWLPTVPVRMYHHRDDELVPYSNSQVAFDAFSTAGAKRKSLKGPGVELVEERIALDISASDPERTVHLGAAFPELAAGWRWLDSFRK